jgi:hypothetical protein
VPLSDDQRALLRLLAQREEGYEDIAALMGLSVAELRARVKEALLELEGAGASDAASDPTERAPVARAPQPPRAEESRESEEAPATPSAETAPSRAAPPAPASAPSPPSAAARAARPRASRPKDWRRLTELFGGALVILLIVLFATGAVDLGGDDSGSDGSDTAASPAETVAAEDGKLTQASLEPVEGGDAGGRALFGRLGKEVVLQVIADGLEPTATGESYTVWLYRSPKLVLRVGAVEVGEAGQLGARFPLPAELLAYVANGAFKQIYLSRTSAADYRAELAQAKRRQRLPRYTGETVLRGEITGPLVKK